MRIINRKEFLKEPFGTVFCKGKKWYWDQLCVKQECFDNDWRYLEFDQVPSMDSGEWLANQERMLETGDSMPIMVSSVRDGSFDDEDIFLVYDEYDIKILKGYL